MKKNKRADMFAIDENTIECDISYRGGRLMVNVSSLFPGVDDPRMGASQNYLGGGIAGSISGGAMFDPDELNKADRATFEVLLERIKRHFYDINHGGGDEYMQENHTGPEAGGYEATQKMPNSAY